MHLYFLPHGLMLILVGKSLDLKISKLIISTVTILIEIFQVLILTPRPYTPLFTNCRELRDALLIGNGLASFDKDIKMLELKICCFENLGIKIDYLDHENFTSITTHLRALNNRFNALLRHNYIK